MQLIRRKKREDKAAAATLDLYYASDVHGSDQCWRKFLGAGRFYGVNALIMGGDLTGKAIVPITMDGESFSASSWESGSAGRARRISRSWRARSATTACIPGGPSRRRSARRTATPRSREQLFEQVIVDELRRWIELADERMADYGIDVFVMPGNDDPWSCDAGDRERGARAGLRRPDRACRRPRDDLVRLREPDAVEQPARAGRGRAVCADQALAEQLESPETAIFNLHVPPHDSGLDTANEINPDLTLVFKSGQPNPIPVGSTAVRQIIEEYQPLLALHGHIHESRGEARIGRTLAHQLGIRVQQRPHPRRDGQARAGRGRLPPVRRSGETRHGKGGTS